MSHVFSSKIQLADFCIASIYSHMSCPFTGPKMFCATPNFLSQPKNLTAFSASSKTFVPAQKTILPNANHIFVWHKMCTKCLRLPPYINRFFVWHKKFGLAKNILGPVKGQGISLQTKLHKNLLNCPLYVLQTDRRILSGMRCAQKPIIVFSRKYSC